jgi:hypothetical protein
MLAMLRVTVNSSICHPPFKVLSALKVPWRGVFCMSKNETLCDSIVKVEALRCGQHEPYPAAAPCWS